MARLPRVVTYVDMPLQHAHRDDAARACAAAVRRRATCGSSSRFRAAMPEAQPAHARSSSGFPVRPKPSSTRSSRSSTRRASTTSGVFTYSHEDGTPGARARRRRARRGQGRAQGAAARAPAADRVREQRRRASARTPRCWSRARTPRPSICSSGALATQAREVDGQVLLNDGYAEAGVVRAGRDHGHRGLRPRGRDRWTGLSRARPPRARTPDRCADSIWRSRRPRARVGRRSRQAPPDRRSASPWRRCSSPSEARPPSPWARSAPRRWASPAPVPRRARSASPTPVASSSTRSPARWWRCCSCLRAFRCGSRRSSCSACSTC